MDQQRIIMYRNRQEAELDRLMWENPELIASILGHIAIWFASFGLLCWLWSKYTTRGKKLPSYANSFTKVNGKIAFTCGVLAVGVTKLIFPIISKLFVKIIMM